MTNVQLAVLLANIWAASECTSRPMKTGFAAMFVILALVEYFK